MVTFSEINGAVNITSEASVAATRRQESMMDLVNPLVTGNPRAEALGLVQRDSLENVFASGSCCHATGTWGCRAQDSGNSLPAMQALIAAVARN